MFVFTENAATFGAAFTRPVRNRILQSLSPREFESLKPHFQLLGFRQREIIHRENAFARGVFFVEEGLIARTVQTRAEAPFEIALEGRSGVLGLAVVLGGSTALNQTMAVVAGTALKIDKPIFQDLLQEFPGLKTTLLRHLHALGLQISYLSLCNSRHSVEQRVPRWLLAACDQLGSEDIPVTQETIATLLGVRRPGVTEVLQKLQKDRVVAKSRGFIRVLDPGELANRSCLCHRLIRDNEVRYRLPSNTHQMPVGLKAE